MKTNLLWVVLAVSACVAPKPEDIPSSYISERIYLNHTCDQIAQDLRKYETQLTELNATQKKARSDDIAGLVLLAAPLGNDVTTQIAESKGHLETLDKISIKKNCADG